MKTPEIPLLWAVSFEYLAEGSRECLCIAKVLDNVLFGGMMTDGKWVGIMIGRKVFLAN